jgi:hypothetical protein
MLKNFSPMAVLACAILFLSSCSMHRTIADSNSRVNFTAEDFTITGAYGGQATVTKVLGIDWARLFNKRTGSVGSVTGFSVPVVGSLFAGDRADEYALYDLLQRHPGYDAVFYPKFQRKHINILCIYSRSKSQVNARLGKLKVDAGDGDVEEQK